MRTFISFFTAVVIIIVLVIACAKSDKSVSDKKESAAGWKDSEKKTFIDDCMSSMHKSIPKEKAAIYCDCMMEKIMAKYNKYANTIGRDRSEFKSMIDSCDKKSGIEGYE